MPVAQPETLTLTYADGSTTSVAFAELPAPLRAEVLCQPSLRRLVGAPAEDRFLLLEWEDGWKEVYRVDPGCTAIKRYYVISRTEEVGRLALEHESGYPQLISIGRRPLGLRRVSLDGTYALAPGRSAREGGKTDTHFTLEPAPDSLREVAASLAAGGDAAALGLTAAECGRDLDDFVAALAAREGA